MRALKFNNNDLISASEDMHAFVTDVTTMQRKQTIVGHKEWITQISVHPQNPEVFLTASLDNTIKIWSASSHKEVQTINMGSPVWSASYSPTGDFFAAVTENGTVSLVNCKLVPQ